MRLLCSEKAEKPLAALSKLIEALLRGPGGGVRGGSDLAIIGGPEGGPEGGS